MGKRQDSIYNRTSKNSNLDGIECYYSNFTEEQIKELLEYCKKTIYIQVEEQTIMVQKDQVLR